MQSKIYRLIPLFLLVTLLPLASVGVVAEDATLRMKDRLTQIDSLKASGSVGENVDGILEIRGPLGPRQTSMVEAENADRLIVYKEVAKRTGQSATSVGQQRALRIAEIAGSGVWLEKPGGEWFQKP